MRAQTIIKYEPQSNRRHIPLAIVTVLLWVAVWVVAYVKWTEGAI